MNKTTRNILFGVGGLFLGIYLYGKLSKKLRKPSQEALSMLNMDLLLEKGSKGAEVSELQRILKDDLGYDLGSSGAEGDGIDGDFGSITENALFQAKGVRKTTLKQMYDDKK
jgi:hypothetical protein